MCCAPPLKVFIADNLPEFLVLLGVVLLQLLVINLSAKGRHSGRGIAGTHARAAARSEQGLASVALGAKALALTALDLIEDPALLMKIKQDHAKAVAEQ